MLSASPMNGGALFFANVRTLLGSEGGQPGGQRCMRCEQAGKWYDFSRIESLYLIVLNRLYR